MNLERDALAVILPGFEGPVAPDWVRRRLSEGLGGVVLFGWNVESPEQLRELTACCGRKARFWSESTRRAGT